MKTIRISLFALAGILIAAHGLVACPVCYGGPDQPLAAGMNTAIIVMLGITGFVLSSIVGVFLVLWRRARRNGAMLSDQLSVNEQGNLEEMNQKGVIEWNNF